MIVREICVLGALAIPPPHFQNQGLKVPGHCVALLVAAWSGSRMLLRWFEQQQVYCPSRNMEGDGADLGCPFEEVYLTTSDSVRLHGWFFPAQRKVRRAQLAFLLLH